jgi:DNA processing protein
VAASTVPPDPDPAVVWAAVLAQEGVGPTRIAAWRRAHASLREALEAARSGRAQGVAPDVAAALRRGTRDGALRRAEHAVRRWRAHHDALLALGAPGYPPALAQLVAAPPLLFVHGRLPRAVLEPPGLPRAVAVVGTRRASPWATAFARDLGRDLARADVSVVSGLALGVDGAAHRGALEGTRDPVRSGTIAVLAGGLDAVHPPHHERLAARIRQAGALVSEDPPGVRPRRGSFPRRNRIVVGLSAALAVVEAPFRSGVAHTVRAALDADRDIFVVPHRPDSVVGRAAAALLRDGAGPLTGGHDLLAALGVAPPPDAGAGRLPDDAVGRAIVARLRDDGPAHEDGLIACAPSPLALLAALGRLEAGGWIARDTAGRWRSRDDVANVPETGP